MADKSETKGTPPGRVSDQDVQGLARGVLDVLSARDRPTPEELQRRLLRLCQDFLADDDALRHESVARLLSEGVSRDDVIDYVLPEVARILGHGWAEDSLSFAEVTIGAARAQETVRLLSEQRHSAMAPLEEARSPSLPRVLLIVPRPENHTMGIFVAADQFQRMGYSVKICVDQTPSKIGDLVRLGGFSLVGLTVSGRRTLASTRELVDKIRRNSLRVTPIVLGGTLVETGLNLKALTGVDHVVSTAREALERAGLEIAGTDSLHEEVS